MPFRSVFIRQIVNRYLWGSFEGLFQAQCRRLRWTIRPGGHEKANQINRTCCQRPAAVVGVCRYLLTNAGHTPMAPAGDLFWAEPRKEHRMRVHGRDLPYRARRAREQHLIFCYRQKRTRLKCLRLHFCGCQGRGIQCRAVQHDRSICHARQTEVLSLGNGCGQPESCLRSGDLPSRRTHGGFASRRPPLSASEPRR